MHTMGTGREIRLTEYDDGYWTACDLKTELFAQGKSRNEALENLDGVIAAVEDGAGREPTDEELEALGIDPEENTPGEPSGELPEVLK